MGILILVRVMVINQNRYIASFKRFEVLIVSGYTNTKERFELTDYRYDALNAVGLPFKIVWDYTDHQKFANSTQKIRANPLRNTPYLRSSLVKVLRTTQMAMTKIGLFN